MRVGYVLVAVALPPPHYYIYIYPYILILYILVKMVRRREKKPVLIGNEINAILKWSNFIDKKNKHGGKKNGA